MDKFNTKYLLHTGIITAIGILIMMLGMLLPFLNFLLVIIPVPYIVLGVRSGLRYSIISLALTSMVVSLFVSPVQGVFFLCTTGAPTIAIAYSIKNKYTLSKTMIMGSLGTVISLFALYTVLVQLTNNSMVELIDAYINAISTKTSQLTQLGDAAQAEDIIKEKALLLKILFPSMLVSIAVVQTYIYIYISRLFLDKLGYKIDKARTLSYFSVPNSFFGGSLIIIVLTYVTSYLNIVDSDALASNLLYIGFLVMVFQGISVLSFILEKRGIGNTLRRVILSITFLLGVFNMVLGIVGMVDMVLNIRRLQKPTQ